MQPRTVLGWLAGALLLASGFSVFLLLIPIPNTLAIGMPQDMQCEYFAANRQGWACARFGNVTTQPLATVAAFSVSLVGAFLLRFSTQQRLPTHLFLLLLWGFFFGLAGLLGSTYFLFGHAKLPYGVVSLSALALWPILYLFLKRFPYKGLLNGPLDPRRKKKLAAGIELEISARNAQRKNTIRHKL